MTHYLLTAAGPDRPGLVADVAKILYGLGCNLEDSSMTRLRGEFAMIVIFSAPDGAKPRALAAKLKALEKSGLFTRLKPLTPRERRAPESAGWPRLVTVYGADRPGIVYRAAQALARKGFNVTDLSTYRTEGPTAGYILYLEGEAPAAVSDDDLSAALRGETEGCTVAVKSLEPAAL
jgi:glycine cleavage system transcriptional repressor